jgi:hypothetical protein
MIEFLIWLLVVLGLGPQVPAPADQPEPTRAVEREVALIPPISISIPSSDVVASCHEDEPCWDPTSMGNGLAGGDLVECRVGHGHTVVRRMGWDAVAGPIDCWLKLVDY